MRRKTKSATNSARSEASRTALISAARRLFAEKGYTDASTPEIVASAGMTRGALYHHFEDKLGLFRAVVKEEYSAVAAEIDASASRSGGSALDALRQGGHGYIKAMNDQGRVRIMLRDGPAVLGQSELDAIDRASSADTLRRGLAEAMQAGQIKTLPLEALTTQLSALFDRAALAISEGDASEDHLEVLEAFLMSFARK